MGPEIWAKTTATAKLAMLLKKEGKSVALAARDVYRRPRSSSRKQSVNGAGGSSPAGNRRRSGRDRRPALEKAKAMKVATS